MDLENIILNKVTQNSERKNIHVLPYTRILVYNVNMCIYRSSSVGITFRKETKKG